MAVVIRLARQGAKKRPNYLIVADNQRSNRDGGYLEKLGQYFPKAEAQADKVKVNQDAVQKWVARGAIMTQTVGQLLRSAAK